MSRRVHIVGASGSGTTTLGRALARRLECPHLDTDDYFWLPTDPPFLRKRSRPARQALLEADLSLHDAWVLSGWGDMFIPLFDLVVFLWVPPAVRLARLRERERGRYGDAAIAPGGAMHQTHTAFIAWAAAYDDGDLSMRSRRMHEEWLAALPCPVLRLAEPRATAEHLERMMEYLSASPADRPDRRSTTPEVSEP